MRSSSPLSWALVLVLAFVALLSPSVEAQSNNCHACIQRAIPTVGNCTSLTAAQLTNLDKVVLGQEVYSSPSEYKTADAAAFQCLASLMWDIVEYQGKLWGTCLDPGASCPWAEMMQYLEMIPRMAAVYGAPNPPAQVLKNAPA